jgi:predicted enzyme related to lactoylglutathione lyase
LSDFIWYELMTPDVDRAQKFYGDVVGYSIIPSVNPDFDYRMWALREIVLGGLMKIPEGAASTDIRAAWLGYVHVADVDDAADSIVAAGGKILMRPTTIPNIGRLALVTDPQGAPFYVMVPKHGGAFTSLGPKLGQCSWNELHTTDSAAALDFYVKQFGWVNSGDIDMGAMGTYHMFSTGAGGPVGGMMVNPQVPRPGWLFYLNVEDIEAAIARVEAAGGRTLFGPQQVPGGQWVITAIDPDGATFALRAPK